MRSQAQLKRSALIRQSSPTFEDYMNQRLLGKTHKQIQNEKNDERTKK
jgi:hypothetical protein